MSSKSTPSAPSDPAFEWDDPAGDGRIPTSSTGQETDVWWGAYAGRTFVPVFALCTLVSVNVALAAGWFWDAERLHPQLMWHLTVLLIVAVWFFPLTLWIYRTLSRTYRLTTRALYRDCGFRCPADGHLELTRIARVRVHYTAAERLVGVGRIVVETEAAKPLVLDGVHHPESVAQLIRHWAELAQHKKLPL